MKELVLENYGMKELSTSEMKEVNGGGLITAVYGAIKTFIQGFFCLLW